MILWWEALLLLLTYVCYVLFMKINASAERTVTKFLYKNKVTRVRSTDHLVPGVSISSLEPVRSPTIGTYPQIVLAWPPSDLQRD